MCGTVAWLQVKPVEMMSNSTLPLGFLHSNTELVTCGQLLPCSDGLSSGYLNNQLMCSENCFRKFLLFYLQTSLLLHIFASEIIMIWV